MKKALRGSSCILWYSEQKSDNCLTVPLCPDCHRGPKGVHHNKQLDLHIKRYAQMQFEKEHSYEEFVKLFGKNYR